MGKFWGRYRKVLGCEGRCREVLEEVLESVLGK